MVLYDGLQGTFRTINLRHQQTDCAVCGISPSITSLEDYDSWCQSCALGINVLATDARITCCEYKTIIEERKEHCLIDVREEGEFQICHFNNAISILTACYEIILKRGCICSHAIQNILY